MSERSGSWRVNLNPPDVSLLRLIAEDLRVHNRDPLVQGFWALAVHRLGNWGKGLRLAPLRLVSRVAYRFAARFVEWTCGISINHNTRVGRRVRIWHHSGILLNAESIGDDVVIRQNTTIGNLKAGSLERPVIENNVEIGCNVSILGGIRVGEGSIIGANAAVTRDIPPFSIAVGVPAKVIRSSKDDKPGAASDTE